MKTSAVIIGAVVVASSLACTPGASEPTTPTSTTTDTSQPSTTPPAITRPLDASTYRDRICDLVTDEQASEHGFTAPGRISSLPPLDPEFNAVECTRTSIEQPPTLDVTYYYNNDLLGRIYGRRHHWGRTGFTVLSIAGQPAARSNLADELKHCEVAVGLTTNQSINVRAIYTDNACNRVVEIAEVIVRKLGG